MRSRKQYMLLLLLFVLLTVSAYFVLPAKATPCAILKVSLPDGVYHGYDVDPWLCESYLLNLTGASQTFVLHINNTSASLRSYDTHLVIALNDAGYNNLVSLVVNGTSVPKLAFKWGTPQPYKLWTWPSGDVYPTWFNDACINVGYIPKKGYKTLVVSVTFSDATNVRIHFDAYGKTVSGTPTSDGQITHNSLSQDSTVLLYEAVGPPPPQPPVAIFSYTPTYPETNQVVTFDASDSYDPDGYIVSYAWNFGDGTPTVVEYDPIIYHTYTSYEDYNVTLTVTDNSSLTAEETAKIHVSQHPVAVFTFSPPDPLIHETVTFDASASTPDGGTIVGYTWDFGDGNITSTENPIITHAYNNYGTYTVTLNVTDSEGKWDTTSQQITVEKAPIADFYWSPYCPQKGETVTFDASASTPDGGTIVGYAWDFGDGTPIVEESDPITTHVYATIGEYIVTLNVTDSEGRWDTETKTIQVVPFRYYLTVKTDPEGVVTIPGENWYNESTEATLTAPDSVPVSTGVRYKFSYWDVDGTPKTGNPITVLMDANHTATAHYILEYYLTVSSPFGTVGGEGWYTNGATAYATLDTSVVDHGNWTRRVFTSWSGDASGTNYAQSEPIIMNGPKTAIANWKTQYYLNLPTNPPGVTTPSGTGWHDAGTYVTISTPEYVQGGSRYRFACWTTEDMNEITDPFSPSTTVLVDKPKNVTANYVHQHIVTFAQTGLGSDASGTVVTVNGTPLAYSDLPYSIWVDENSLIVYSYESTVSSTVSGKRFVLLSVTGPSSPITVTADITVTGNYKTQFYLEVSSAYGSPTPASGWYDSGSSILASVDSPVSGPTGTRYVCTGWTGTGSVPSSGTGTSVTFTLNAPSSITWNWKTQYLLTVVTDPTGLSPQPTRNPTGEAGPANGWWYDASTSVTLTAQTVTDYTFNYWDVDGASQGSGVNPITVVMNAPHTATAHYTYTPPPPLSVSISPPSASMRIGQSVKFTSTVSGGAQPYNYQWYLNGSAVSGATSENWTFSPSLSGTYIVYLRVTDKNGNAAQSDSATVMVSPAQSVGGYSISLASKASNSQLTAYATLITLFSMVLIAIRRKRK